MFLRVGVPYCEEKHQGLDAPHLLDSPSIVTDGSEAREDARRMLLRHVAQQRHVTGPPDERGDEGGDATRRNHRLARHSVRD